MDYCYPPVPRPKYKLTIADVRLIRALKGQATRAELSARFGVSKSNISAIWQHRNWTRLDQNPGGGGAPFSALSAASEGEENPPAM